MIKLRIIMEGGVLQDIAAINEFNEPVEVEIRDYDIDGLDESELEEDEEGNQYYQQEYNFNQPDTYTKRRS